MYRSIFKPVLDFVLALIGLVLLLPVFIINTVLLIIANDGKPFFFQKRHGKNEEIISIIKFKSMNDKKDSEGNLLPNEKRITTIGKFIRKTSIDELPQLINVLKGEMSFIGPRPLPIRYLELYNSEQRKRHNVKPGITGWAQVNGRNNITWKRKFQLDVWYVENLSFFLDIKILFMTIIKILCQSEVNLSDDKIGAVGFNGDN